MAVLDYKYTYKNVILFILFFLPAQFFLLISSTASAYKIHAALVQNKEKNSKQQKYRDPFLQRANYHNKKNLSGEEANSALWSNAFNFQKAWNTQVDPRTGLFFAHIRAGSLISNTGHGPNINLEINYNSNSTSNPDNLGQGWSWNLTHFNPQNNQLFTSQGQSFNLQQTFDGRWWPRYHKLHDLQIDGSKKNHLRITYANGLREILNHHGYEIRLEQQDGRGVNFSYRTGTHQLTAICDDLGYKIILLWHENYLTVISRDSDGKPIRINLSFIKNKLRDITLQSNKNQSDPGLHISYHDNLLNILHYSSGMGKYIIYDCNHAMKIALNGTGKIHALCVVIREVINPGSFQPERVINYTYDQSSHNEHNYLGFNSGLERLSGIATDDLFEAPVNYTYQTTEDNGLVKQIRTYNKYHLLINAQLISKKSGKLLSEMHNFFCNTDQYDGCSQTSFEDLPATYSLPLKVVTKDWGGSSGQPSVNTETKAYDSEGRLTSTTDTYGRKDKITYCPVDGNTACPAQPAEWSLNTPVESVIHYPSYKVTEPSRLAPVSTHNYYCKQDNINGDGYILVLARKVMQSGNEEFITTNNYYNDKQNSFTYGLLQQQTLTGTTTVNAKLKTVTSTYHYFFNTDDYSRTSYSMIKLSDDTWRQSPVETISLFTNQVLRRRDAEGKNIIRYHYDNQGRLIQTDFATGTLFASSEHYQYTVSESLNQLIITAANGLQKKIIFDGSGKPLSVFAEAISAQGKMLPGQWRPVEHVTYDNYGRVIDKIAYTIDDHGIVHPLITWFHYNDMGHVTRTDLPDGETIIKEYSDPDRCIVSYCLDKHQHHSVISVLRANVLDKPVIQSILPASVTIADSIKKLCLNSNLLPEAKTVTTRYDGFGRAFSVTDAQGRVISKHFDLWGRVSDIVDPVGDKLHNVYNLTGQVIQKWAQPARDKHNYLLDSAEYNAAGDLLWQDKEGGKRTLYTYTADGKLKASTTPSGNTISWMYNVLNLPVSEYVNKRQLLKISFDHLSRRIIKKNDITGTTTYHYSDDGKLQQVNHSGEHGYPDYHLDWRYNQNRQLISTTDLSGNSIQTDYDIFGRISSLYYQPVNHKKQLLYHPIYDDFSRLVSARYGSGMQRIIHYNENDQQDKIIDMLKGKILSKWQYRYDKIGNIVSIRQSVGKNQQAILYYTYDLLDNLTSMRCTGSARLPLCPRETHFTGSGLKQAPVITRQSYTFNALNRLIQLNEQLINVNQNKMLRKITAYHYFIKTPLRLQRINTQWNIEQPAAHSLFYDVSGNMVSDSEENLLTYNAFNQITDVTTPKGQHSHYVYDGSGREAKAVTSTGNIRYLIYISKHLAGEKFYNSDSKLHTVDYLGAAKIIDGTVHEYYEKNYKGDIAGILTKTKKGNYHLSQLNIYSPYGRVWHSIPESADLPLYQQTLQGFDGEQTDPSTGWQFLGAGHRVYNPGQRCFTSEDPVGGGYAFGSNNPIMNTDPSGNIPHWLGNVLSALNYAGTLGFAALHRRWAMITGTVLMMGLSTFAAVAALVAEEAPPLLTAATAGYTAGINGVFIASAAAPNKGLNIAGAIVGGIDVAVTLATAGTGIASAGASWVKRIMNVETDGIITGNKTRRVVMEMRHFVEDDDKGRIPVGRPPPVYFSIQNRGELNSIWHNHFSSHVQEMTHTHISSLLAIAFKLKKPIDKDSLFDLIILENRVKVNLATQEMYYNEVEKIAREFGDFKLYDGVNVEDILPSHSPAIVIGNMTATGKRFIGYLVYSHSTTRSVNRTYCWYLHEAYRGVDNGDIRVHRYFNAVLMGAEGPLKADAILRLGRY